MRPRILIRCDIGVCSVHTHVRHHAGGNCGVNSWTSSSHIVHATADTAAGPFVYQDVSLGCESTNPHALYDPKTDVFTIFHLGDASSGGCGGGGPYSSNGACTGIDGHYGDDANETFPKGQPKKHFVHQSAGPNGPWTTVEGGMACNNPAPMLLKNGSIYLVCHNKSVSQIHVQS